jgi:hypothetical protein
MAVRDRDAARAAGDLSADRDRDADVLAQMIARHDSGADERRR